MMNKDLKDCPFCGGNARIVAGINYTSRLQIWRIECTKCDCGTGWIADRTEAVKAWDRRISDDRGSKGLSFSAEKKQKPGQMRMVPTGTGE